MSSIALLKVSEIANGPSTTKEDDALQLLVAQSTTQLDTVMFYVNAITKQQTLPVKNILSNYVDHVSASSVPVSEKQALYEALVNQFTPPTVSVSLALTKTVLNLATLYEAKYEYTKAIEALKILNTDVIVQDFQDVAELDEFRVQLNLRIAQNCLNSANYESAENHLTRITPLLTTLSNKLLVHDVQKTSVKVMVRVQKWLEAATRLLSLDDESYDAATVLYSILIPYSQFKGNLFQNVVKSPHVLISVIDTPLSLIFGKMQQSKLIYAKDVTNLMSFIAQSPIDIGGSVESLQKALAIAVVENNLISSSKIFENVTLETFAGLLELDPECVEEIAAEMVRSERLSASVDDIGKLITFTESQDGLKEWEQHVVGSCAILDKIVDDLVYESHVSA